MKRLGSAAVARPMDKNTRGACLEKISIGRLLSAWDMRNWIAMGR